MDQRTMLVAEPIRCILFRIILPQLELAATVLNTVVGILLLDARRCGS